MAKKFRDFKSAREFVRGLKLKGIKEWNAYCQSRRKPDDIPYHPERKYKDNGWISWGDFLGTGNISSHKIKFRNWKSCIEYVRDLGITSENEWRSFCKSGDKPDDIPTVPSRTYKKEWMSWGDFLGTGRVADQLKEYRDFKSAREFVRGLKLQSQKEWRDYCKSGNKPDDIPFQPHGTYKNKGWIGMGDWLGTGNIASKDRQLRDFKSSREFVRNLELKSQREWHDYCKSGNKPDDIPRNPHRSYNEKGWISFGDWLGTGNVAPQEMQFMDFESAKEFARSLKLKGVKEWEKFCQSGKKPKEIPSAPNKTYKDNGWKGWGDFLGTGNVSNVIIGKQFLSFKEAREEARKLAKKYNIKNWEDWRNAVKKGLIPKNIPASPWRTYGKKRKKDGKRNN